VRHALDELERRGQTMNAGACEGEAVVSAETDDVEPRAVRFVEDRARITDENAMRLELREVLAERQVLIANVARRAPEEEFLIAHLRDLVVVSEDEQRGHEHAAHG